MHHSCITILCGKSQSVVLAHETSVLFCFLAATTTQLCRAITGFSIMTTTWSLRDTRKTSKSSDPSEQPHTPVKKQGEGDILRKWLNAEL